MDVRKIIARERLIIIGVVVLCGSLLLTGILYKKDLQLKQNKAIEFVNSKSIPAMAFEEQLTRKGLLQDWTKAEVAQKISESLINKLVYVILFGYLFLLLIRFSIWDIRMRKQKDR